MKDESGADWLSDRRRLETLGSQPRSARGGWSLQTKAPTKVRPPASRVMPSCKYPSVGPRWRPAPASHGEKPEMRVRSAVTQPLRTQEKGTYRADKRQAGTSRASRKGVVAQICSPSALPPSFSPYHLLLLLLLLLTARCWLDQCSLPWQPKPGGAGGSGGASRDRASLFPDWWEGGGVGCREGNDVTCSPVPRWEGSSRRTPARSKHRHNGHVFKVGLSWVAGTQAGLQPAGFLARRLVRR